MKNSTKGLLLPFATTIAVVLVAVAIIIGAVFIRAMMALTGTSIDNRFDFVSLVERPYDIALVSSDNVIDSRTFMERSLHSSLSLDNKIDFSDLSYFIEIYDVQYFFFNIYTDPRVAETLNAEYIYSMDNIPHRCGANEEGFCQSKFRGVDKKAGYCGVARVEIPDNNMCPDNSVCCQLNQPSYEQQTSHYDVFSCGEDNIGYCSAKVRGVLFKTCGTGFFRYKEGEDSCKDVNNGKTPVCCVPLDEENIVTSGAGSVAEIPLLYKGETLYEPKNYQCQNINDGQCAGEYIRYHCLNLPSEVQCCVTDVIHCMPPYEQYVCMDRQNCEAGGNAIIENPGEEKLCPGEVNYVCCETTESVKGETPEQPLQSYGTCTLGDEAYNARPFVGTAELYASGPLLIKGF